MHIMTAFQEFHGWVALISRNIYSEAEMFGVWKNGCCSTITSAKESVNMHMFSTLELAIKAVIAPCRFCCLQIWQL